MLWLFEMKLKFFALKLFLFLLLCGGKESYAVDYYWVGGQGNWSDFSNHWATTSGGSTFHTTIPSLVDDVYFDTDSYSIGDTVFIDIAGQCNDIHFQSAKAIIYANQNLTCAGEFDVDAVQFELNGNVLNAFNIDLSFSSFLALRSVDFSNSTVNLIGDGTVLEVESFNLTEDFTNAIFNLNYPGANPVLIEAGGANVPYTELNVNVANFTTIGKTKVDTIFFAPGSSIFLDDGPGDNLECYKMTLLGDCGNPIYLNSTTTNQAYIDLLGQTVIATGVHLTSINGTNGTYNASGSIDQGNNTGWVLTESPSNINYYWVLGTGNWSDPGHWATTSGGIPNACIPGPDDNVIFDNNSGAGFVTTVDVHSYCDSMTWTGLVGAPDLTGSEILTIRGSIVLDAPMTASFTGGYDLSAIGTETITSDGVVLNANLRFSNGSGDWSLLDDFQSNEFVFLDSGAFSTGTNDMNIGGMIGSLASPRTLDITASQIVLSETGTVWNLDSTFLTFTSTNSEIQVNHPNANLTIFEGGYQQYSAVRFFNNQSELRDSNHFEILELVPGAVMSFEAAVDQHVDSLIASGTCALPITIQSSNNTSPAANLIKTGVYDTLILDYCNILNVTADATPPKYYLAMNSILGFNTTGWDTTSATGGDDYFWVNGSGNWSDLTHWESPVGIPAVCLPTIRDTVHFDNNSFTLISNNVELDIIGNCYRMDWTNSDTESPNFNMQASLNVRQNVILNTTMTVSNSDTLAQIRFIPVLNNCLFTTLDRPVETNVFMNGFVIGDTLKLDGNLRLDDASSLEIGAGTFDSNSDSIFAGNFYTSGAEDKLLLLNNSKILLRESLVFNDYSVGSNMLNVNAGTSEINLLGSAGVDQFYGDDQTFYDLIISSVSTQPYNIFGGSNTFNDVTFNAGLGIFIDSNETQAINGTFTAIGTCLDSIFINSNSTVNATTFNLANAGTVECTNPEGITVTNTVPLNALFSSDYGNNGGWFFDPTQPATANFTAPYDYCFGDIVTFTNTSTAYAGGIGVLDFTWDFGDDTLSSDTSSLVNPTYTYQNDGVWKVYLIATYTNFCSDTLLDSVRINDPNLLVVSSESDTTICDGDLVNFSGTAYAGGGVVTYDYQINNGTVQNTGSPIYATTGLNNGDVVTCIMTANGCIDTSINVYTFTVDNLPGTSLSSSDADDIICDGDLVTYTASGAEKYQFFIDGTPVSPLSTTTVYSTSILTNGQVVTVVGVDTSTSCSFQAPEVYTMTVNPLPNPTMITSDADQVICSGDAVSFTAASATDYEFFVNGASVQGPGPANVYNTTTLNNLDNITVIGYTLGCGSTAPQNFTYFVNAIPNTILLNNTGTSICAGATVSFTGYNATTYEFLLNGGTVQGPSGNPNYSNGTLVSGDQVSVIGTANNCAQTSTVQTFTVNPLPIVTLVADDPDSTICQGDTVTFTAGGAIQYQYYLNGVPVAGATTNPVHVFPNLSNGDIVKVRGFVAGGCNDFSITEYPMTVIPQFNVNLFDSDPDDAICFGETINFTGTGSAITSYELFVNGVSHTINGTGLFAVSNLPLGSPQISLSGTKNGCTYFADDTITINVNVVPTIDMTSSDANNIICDGDSIVFTATGGATYEFLINSISQGVSAIDTLFSDGLNSGDVIDLIGYSGGCSSASLSSFTITVDPIPTTVLSSSDVNNIICEGESITYTASGAINYEFFIDGVSQGPPSPTNILTSNSFIGTLNIYVEGYNTGCSAASNSFNLIVNPLPIIDVAISDPDTTICDGESVTITGIGSGTYEFMINGVSQGPPTSNATYNTNSLVNGDQITIQGIGVNGCFNTSLDLYTFTVIPNPVVSMVASEPDSSICVGDTVTFNGSGAAIYQYYVNGNLASTGPVYVTDSLTNGQIVQIYGSDNICATFGNSIPFSVYSYPVTSIISDDADQTICQGDQVVFTGLGAFDFEFFVNGVSVQGPITQDSLITTTINDGDIITVEGGNQGCITNSPGITFTVNQFPNTTLVSSVPSNQICFGDQVVFTAGSAIQYEFFINGISQDPASTTTIFSSDELNNGDVVTVLGYDGDCAAISANVITMGVDVMPIELTALPGNIICVGDQVDFTGVGADTYEFFIDGTSVQGPSATNTYSTSALVDGQVVSLQGFLAATGCFQYAPTSQLFVVMDNPVVTALSSTTICEGDSVVLQSSYQTWNQWFWDGSALAGENEILYEAYDAGTYHVEVTLGGVDEVWGLGSNAEGQLGDNTTINSLSAIEALGLLSIVEIESGTEFNIVRDNSGAVYVWGNNDKGQLGDGSFTSTLTPIPTSLNNAVDVAAGHEFSVAALSTGAVMTWGNNDFGQLGLGNFATSNFPFAVGGLTNIVMVSAGENHVLALRDDGTVFSWGDNTFGQLGDGTLLTSNVPLQIVSLTGIASVHTGDNHSFAVDSSGQMYVWGSNAHGQLGVNGILFSQTPLLSTIPNVKEADGGTDHSIVLTTQQKVYTFGNNDFGQLGNGTVISEYNPQKMDTLDAVVHIEAAYYQTAVIKGDNSTWTWGRNDDGQLGTNNTIQQNAPVYIPNLTGAADFGLGQNHSSYIVTQENSCASNMIDVIVNPSPDVTITSFGGLFTATPPGDSYQWFIDGIIIPGGTGQSITPTTFGWYTCEVTYPGGCTSLSDPYPWGVVGLEEDAFAFNLYPNPTNGLINITADFDRFENFEIEIYSMLGQVLRVESFDNISQNVTIDLEDYARGSYMVYIKSEGAVIGKRKVVLH